MRTPNHTSMSQWTAEMEEESGEGPHVPISLPVTLQAFLTQEDWRRRVVCGWRPMQLQLPLKELHSDQRMYKIYLYLYTLAVSPSLGVAGNTKEQQKQWGFHSVLLAMTRYPAEFGWHCYKSKQKWLHNRQPDLAHTPSIGIRVVWIK